MAVSFAANSVMLANWGFSAGDIAAIAGAGRGIGTWVMAQMKDQSLLDFMKVDPEDLIPRKGIIDPIALHKRWDVSLTLLQNGRKRFIKSQGRPLIERMPKFSWFMVLIVSGLDASLGLADFRRVISRFLTSLFAEHVDGVDYVLRELPYHLQGWMSAACVRSVLAKARREWANLAERGVRRYGQIPFDDCQEIERLLIWLSGACGHQQEKTFETASSDVYALAIVLQAIGFDLISTIASETGDNESQLRVIYNPNMVVTGRPARLHGELNVGRYGMRIPLDFMEECVSIWPGTLEENNFRRLLFTHGMEAGRDIQLEDISWRGAELSCHMVDATIPRLGRVSDANLLEFVDLMFPALNSKIVETMSRILAKHPQWSKPKRWNTLEHLATNPSCLAEVQIFIMGYYYTMLQCFLGYSLLTVREAYGSWRWNDINLLRRIAKSIQTDGRLPGDRDLHFSLDRHQVLQLVAILFAGAEEVQYDAINYTVMGFHGKITILPASLLGHTDTWDAVAKIHLLDFDSTAIPSNARGMILNSQPFTNSERCYVPSEEKLQEIKNISPNSMDEDLSSHIEPDWDNDVQACHITYRYKGRVVRRFSPTQIEQAMAYLAKFKPFHRADSEPPGGPYPWTLCGPSNVVYLEHIGSFFDRRWPAPEMKKPSILLAVKGRRKARTCLLVSYLIRDFQFVDDVGSWPKREWLDYKQGTMVLYDTAETYNFPGQDVSAVIIA